MCFLNWGASDKQIPLLSVFLPSVVYLSYIHSSLCAPLPYIHCTCTPIHQLLSLSLFYFSISSSPPFIAISHRSVSIPPSVSVLSLPLPPSSIMAPVCRFSGWFSSLLVLLVLPAVRSSFPRSGGSSSAECGPGKAADCPGETLAACLHLDVSPVTSGRGGWRGWRCCRRGCFLSLWPSSVKKKGLWKTGSEVTVIFRPSLPSLIECLSAADHVIYLLSSTHLCVSVVMVTAAQRELGIW